jgi:hypothetical protein
LELEFAVRVVRYLLRVSALMLVGVAVFCGLVLLLNAQILLNRYAELHMMDTDTSGPILNRRADAADNGPALAPVTDKSTRTGGSAISESQTMPQATFPDGERAAIPVSGAERVADVAAADRWVDVILTHRPATGAAFSEVVLENVKVLAIELISGNVGERSAEHAVKLDIDSETIENLLLASRSGKLSLALHRPPVKHPLEARRNGNTTLTRSLTPPAAAVRHTADVEVAAGAAVSVSDAPPAALPDVADTAPMAGSESPPASGPDLASIVPSSSGDATPAARAEVADTPAADAPGDEHFTVVTVNRVGGSSSIHRVPRER